MNSLYRQRMGNRYAASRLFLNGGTRCNVIPVKNWVGLSKCSLIVQHRFWLEVCRYACGYRFNRYFSAPFPYVDRISKDWPLKGGHFFLASYLAMRKWMILKAVNKDCVK